MNIQSEINNLELNMATSKLTKKCCDEKSIFIKVVILFLITLISLLYITAYQMPSSFETEIEKKLNIKTHQFQYLFSVFTLSSALFCMIGGIMTDKYFGVKNASIIFAVVATLGQILVNLGGYLNSFWIMVVGRFILGGGSECLGVVTNCYAVIWFKSNELSFVFGFYLLVGKGLGSSITFLLGKPLYNFSNNYKHTLGVFMLPFSLCMIFLIIICIILGQITTKFKKHASKSNSNNIISLKEIIKFSCSFWVCSVIILTFMVSITTFLPLMQRLVADKYNLKAGDANYYCTLFNIFVAGFSPIPGALASKTGHYLYYNIVGFTAGIISLIIFIFVPSSPLLSLSLYSINFSVLNCCSWNLIPLLVESYQLATAYGTVTFTFNLLATFSTVLCGYLLENCGSNSVAILLLCLGICGFICTLLLLLLDKRKKGLLNVSIAEKELRSNLIKC